MSELICALDVGTTKIVALIAELDENNNLRIIGAGRVPSIGLQRGIVVDTAKATASIGQAIEAAEASADQVIEDAFVGISGAHITAIGSKGVIAVGRSGRKITHDDTLRALEQARNIAMPHNREIINAVPRSYTVDEQPGILNPVGMFGYRLEVDANIITGASSAVRNLVECVRDNGVEIVDLVLEPLASAEAVLTDDERQLGVAIVDIGGGTTDMAIFLESSPWHTQVLNIGGDHFVRDVASGLRMPHAKAEALIRQFGHAVPEEVPPDSEVRSGAFGQEAQQVVNRRLLSEIVSARAEEVVELIFREIKRSGYDGMLPAGVVMTGGVAQLAGFGDLSRAYLDYPVRIGRPNGFISSVMDLSSPEYATAVGLLFWGRHHPSATPVHPVEKQQPSFAEKVLRWLRNLLPQSNT